MDKETFIKRHIPKVSYSHPEWTSEQVQQVCEGLWEERKPLSDEAHFSTVEIETDKPTVNDGKRNMIAVIGDRFMNGGFLPVEVLQKSYKKWNGTLHDINHMGTNTGFFLMQSDITYFIGYHTDVKFDKETKEVSMQLNIKEDTEFATAWQAYVELCELAGRIPNVSVTYYVKRDWITASELPANVPWKAEGYGKDDLVPVINTVVPVCVSTVLQGRCNDKDGCGIRKKENDSGCQCDVCTSKDPKLEAELEEKRQELIKKIKLLEDKLCQTTRK